MINFDFIITWFIQWIYEKDRYGIIESHNGLIEPYETLLLFFLNRHVNFLWFQCSLSRLVASFVVFKTDQGLHRNSGI